jgi:protein-disulfide isomerase/type II secretory pathway component PulC
MLRAHTTASPLRLAAVRVGVPLLSVLALHGCGRGASPGDGSEPAAASPPVAPEQVVATLGDRSVTAAETDAAIASQLQEIDYQRYLLRRQATEALLLRELTAADAKVRTAAIKLVPPLPPVTELPGIPAGYRPEAAAPVTVSVFCNFESPHCAAVQATLADLLGLYPGAVRIAARDLPLPIHPRAPVAAEAARCAGRQGRYWAFHDLLWARGRGLDRQELDHVAQAIGLDGEAFRRCVDDRAEATAVAADVALAQRLGIGIVPAVFVNGRAVPSPANPDRLMWLVEEELKRTAAGGNKKAAVEPTRLPLTLRATIVGESAGLGLALIGGSQPDAPASVSREGERVAPGAILRRVGPEGVELLVAGRVETLSFATGKAVSAAPGERPAAREGEAPPAPVSPPRTSPMPVYLDRELVRERMADRVALSAQLQPVPMTVDGYRLLRLGEVAPGSLYELLGLQAGDVIVAVNEQPIHEGDNPLWDALDREKEVRVRVMRRGGVAQHYTYRFD